MDPKTAKRILSNDEELDIAKLAEAHAEEQKREKKRKHIPSMQRSLSAYLRKKAKEKEEEAWRQKVAKIWKPKTK